MVLDLHFYRTTHWETRHALVRSKCHMVFSPLDAHQIYGRQLATIVIIYCIFIRVLKLECLTVISRVDNNTRCQT